MNDWRRNIVSTIRAIMQRIDPAIIEEMKWQKPSNPSGVSLWSYDGMICTGETYKAKVKLTFAYGASLADPQRLFNGNDTGNTRRSIDVFENDRIDEAAFENLVQEAIAHNRSKLKKNAKAKT